MTEPPAPDHPDAEPAPRASEARKDLPELVEVTTPTMAGGGVVGVEPPVDEPDERLGGSSRSGVSTVIPATG